MGCINLFVFYVKSISIPFLFVFCILCQINMYFFFVLFLYLYIALSHPFNKLNIYFLCFVAVFLWYLRDKSSLKFHSFTFFIVLFVPLSILLRLFKSMLISQICQTKYRFKQLIYL